MRAEIISSGTELLLGEVIDTNTPYLARELAAIGISVYHHTTVGDNPKRLLETIEHAEKRADIVIVSGGLGPTQDDITKDIVGNHLGLELISNEKYLKKIKGRYQTEKISEGNLRQSYVIQGAKVLENDIGMAAGMLVEKNQVKYVLLPGPPNEFEQMVSKYLIPLLAKNIEKNQGLQSRHLNFYGLPEAIIAEKLNELIESQSNPTIAIYAKKGIIDIRLTASGSTEENNNYLLDQIETKIMDRIGMYFIGYDKIRIQDIIFDQLDSLDKTISLIELNINSHLSDFWSENLKQRDHMKASFHFARIEEAQKHFHMNYDLEREKSLVEQNEKLARKMKEKLGTDYAIAISGRGDMEIQMITVPEKLYISMVETDNTLQTKEIRFTQSMYFADWVIPLKISDFIRRNLLSIEQLEE